MVVTSLLLDAKSPIDARSVVNEMRNHFIRCLKEARLLSFTTVTVEV